MSPEQLMQNLKDTRGENGAPFGRLPPATLASHRNYFVRMLVCVEFPGAFYVLLPERHLDLLDKVVEQRRMTADSSAGQPAFITASAIKKVLHDFSTNVFSNESNKRWLLDVLKTPARSRNDPDYLPQLLETMVDDFIQALHDNNVTGLALSSSALAALALYRYILVAAQKNQKGRPRSARDEAGAGISRRRPGC